MWAVAVLALGALVKATAVLPLVLVIVWCVARRPKGERMRAFASTCRAGGGDRPGVRSALPPDPRSHARHARARGPHRVARAVRCSSRRSSTSSASARWVGSRASGSPSRWWCASSNWPGRWRRDRPRAMRSRSSTAAIGWSLVFLMLLGPVLLPWYVVWALPRRVAAAPRAPRHGDHGRRRPRDGAVVDRAPALPRCVQREPVARALGGHAGDVRDGASGHWSICDAGSTHAFPWRNGAHTRRGPPGRGDRGTP